MRHRLVTWATSALVVVAALVAIPASASASVTWGLSLAGWDFPHPPGSPLFAASGYDARMIRVVAPYCGADCTSAENVIRSNLGEMAPLGLGEANLYVVLTCHDSDPCGPVQKTPTYLRSSLKTLMNAFPGIRYWQPQNEPEDAFVPTNSDQGGPALAARLWVTAEQMALRPAQSGIPAGETIVAGEFGMVNGTEANRGGSGPGWYPYRYAEALKRELGSLAPPSTWSLHPYYDVQCATHAVTADFIAHIAQMLGASSAQHFWIAEAGVRLDHWPRCANAENFTAARSGTTAGMARSTQAEVAAAQAFMSLPETDPRIDHVFYYTPAVASLHCWSGGEWDSGLFSSADQSPRPAYYVMTHQPVPSTLPASNLLAPARWLNACGATTPDMPAITSAAEDSDVTGTVAVPRGSFTSSEAMPQATGQVFFYLDGQSAGNLLVASTPLATRDAATAIATFRLPTENIPPGAHTIFALYSDDAHQFTKSFPITVTADTQGLDRTGSRVVAAVHDLAWSVATGSVARYLFGEPVRGVAPALARSEGVL
jgi:hypothetical protein